MPLWHASLYINTMHKSSPNRFCAVSGRIRHTVISASVCALAAVPQLAAAGMPAALWSAENGHNYPGGGDAYVQHFTFANLPDSTAGVAFNMFARRMMPLDPADSIVELVPGYYVIESPRIRNAAASEAGSVTVDILTRGTIRSICYSPDGLHGISLNGKPFDIALERFDLLSDSLALAAAPAAEDIYARNAELVGASAGVYDFVPRFKSVTLSGGSGTVDLDNITFSAPSDLKGTESCRIEIGAGSIAVEADSTQWARLALRLHHFIGHGIVELPYVRIEDSPSLPYRGLMLDVVRNFQPAAEIHRMLDLMAVYGLNTLHFHLTDDETWRVEIQSLPELTRIGSRRGYAPKGTEPDFLPQIFAGNGDPDNAAGTANGYYTRQQMMDILRHADSLAINVIPEIESPGHARAAIVAMRSRPEYRLDEAADTSCYTSAQSFRDNVMNPALPGPYRFMETVVDELAGIYRDAGVPLRAVHIGGDEVPRHAWSGSPAVGALKDSLGLADEKAVHAYFVSRVADMIASKGIAVSGWQEIALRHPEEYNAALRPKVFSVNCWSTLSSQGQGGVVEDIAAAGFPVVLSNVNHFYMDMCYSSHPNERGLNWGGYVDEFDALHGYPSRLAPSVTPIGIQGQLFAETIRSTEGLERLLLPKMLGMAERAWNNDSTYTDAQFNAIIVCEIPRWQQLGATWHVRQPGIVRNGNILTFNSSYPDAEIYITLDGTEPQRLRSQCLRPGASINLDAVSIIPRQARARQWVGGMPSETTVLPL